jgi:hypothetical protein
MDTNDMNLALFWAKVARTQEGCWVWQGTTSRNGYGLWTTGVRPSRRTVQAHRLSWVIVNGPIPEGMCVCHSCDVPPCVNPEHLWLGTARENARDKVAKGRMRRGDSRGERNGHARLTEEDVRAIRARVAGGETQTALAVEYGVHLITVSQAVRRLTWKHVA